MVINKNLSENIPASIDLTEFTPFGKVSVWTLNGPGVDATNESSHDNVKVVYKESVIKDNFIDYVFEPHSLTAIEIERIK